MHRMEQTAPTRFGCMHRLSCCVFALLLTLATAGWVDPDSPLEVHSTRALTNGDNREYELVRFMHTHNNMTCAYIHAVNGSNVVLLLTS